MSNHQCDRFTSPFPSALSSSSTAVRLSVALDRHDLRKVVAHIECGGQLQNDVRQRWVLEQLGGGQWGFAARPLVAAAESAMRAEHNVAKDKAEDKRAQKVVAEELYVGGVWGCEKKMMYD